MALVTKCTDCGAEVHYNQHLCPKDVEAVREHTIEQLTEHIWYMVNNGIAYSGKEDEFYLSEIEDVTEALQDLKTFIEAGDKPTWMEEDE